MSRTMKRCVFCTAAFLVAAVVVYALLGPVPVPADWETLRIGDSIEQATQKVPELRPAPKDGGMNRWYRASREVTHLGTRFRWVMDVDFNEAGELIRLNGRSYNDRCGQLDSTFER